MKLEVGMYVRVKSGEIHKIKSVANKYVEYENGFGVPFDLKDIIIKASFNVIDILEVGDYVNGNKVVNIVEEESMQYLVLDRDEVYYDNCLEPSSDKDIKSIVTKEQFERISYKI